MGKPRRCSCGWCRHCCERATELDRMRQHIREYCERARLVRSAGARRLPPGRRSPQPQVRLTGEMRQALREAIDQRTRERLREFAR